MSSFTKKKLMCGKGDKILMEGGLFFFDLVLVLCLFICFLCFKWLLILVKKFNFYMKRLFWQEAEGVKKVSLSKLGQYLPKQGGFGAIWLGLFLNFRFRLISRKST